MLSPLITLAKCRGINKLSLSRVAGNPAPEAGYFIIPILSWVLLILICILQGNRLFFHLCQGSREAGLRGIYEETIILKSLAIPSPFSQQILILFSMCLKGPGGMEVVEAQTTAATYTEWWLQLVNYDTESTCNSTRHLWIMQGAVLKPPSP